MEWLTDPTAWVGLLTLVVLEIVLGIDNLVFIAILADKLPPEQRDRARLIGLGLALFMRLALLASISWIVGLTQPLFTVFGVGVSGRQLILALGGLFLIYKATTELHERLEGGAAVRGGGGAHASLWSTIGQIVALDLVFSLDSVITAVGMVDDLSVMMTAVVVAVAVMMLASRPLMNFVSAHPTVVVLSLGFLLMIGFSLVAEGLGFHIPKAYLYAAIGFSVVIEAFNQFARRNRRKHASKGDLRQRTADAVGRILGGGREPAGAEEVAAIVDAGAEHVFAPRERTMIQGVLDLAGRPVRTIMTPAPDVVWLDMDRPADELRSKILESGRSHYPIGRGSLNELVGIAPTRELVRGLIDEGRVTLVAIDPKPLVVHEGASALDVMERLRDSPLNMAVVTDEFGAVQGVVTPADVFEAIAGRFPDRGRRDEAPECTDEADGSMRVDATIDMLRLGRALDVDLVSEEDRFATLAGFLLKRFGQVPQPGETLDVDGLRFEIVETDARRIEIVRVTRLSPEPAET